MLCTFDAFLFLVEENEKRERYYMISGREDRIINQMRSIANNCDMQVKSKKKSRNAPQIDFYSKMQQPTILRDFIEFRVVVMAINFTCISP